MKASRNWHFKSTRLHLLNLVFCQEMAPRKRDFVDDLSSDEEINVDKMVEAKQAVDKVMPTTIASDALFLKTLCTGNRFPALS